MVTITQKRLSLLNHPAQLWIGTEHRVVALVEDALQQKLCSHGGCTYCNTCVAIQRHAHHALLWLEPENLYTRDIIQPALDAITLQRDIDSPLYIVFHKADRLSPVTANALLKSLEEPPVCYYFILITGRPGLIIPTIRSRCVVQECGVIETPLLHKNLYQHFTGQVLLDPINFLKTI